MNIKFIISQHNNAISNISELEKVCASTKITDEKTKAQFGNACVALRGYRMVAEATEAMLVNENVLKGEDGFYQKIEDTIRVPEESAKPGSDFDLDKQNHE